MNVFLNAINTWLQNVGINRLYDIMFKLKDTKLFEKYYHISNNKIFLILITHTDISKA